ncbi:hypothetical protein IMZ48_13915 [Candidatus Bathyarchaeota archaeon]|nr:hypothetical protein [Candidatus Bathyarchaeota archaeon]
MDNDASSAIDVYQKQTPPRFSAGGTTFHACRRPSRRHGSHIAYHCRKRLNGGVARSQANAAGEYEYTS